MQVIKVKSKAEAWEVVAQIFPTDYEKDFAESVRQGYNVFRHPKYDHFSRICEFEDYLVILTGLFGETEINVWIEYPKA